MGWVFAGCGAFAICGAAFDWDWFMNNHKARLFVILLGRRGARLVYGFLGSGLVVLGALMAMGILGEGR
ncbi:MAG: immunity 17 family protein [Planctomycetes bacterium]|nr:immunity 17 family protein [Planctomycetota bacterium]